MSISPRFFADHVSVTVANIDAAIEFYDRALGAEVLYRMGPLDSRDAPRENNGKDWTEAHVNVTDACLELAMLSFAGGLVHEDGAIALNNREIDRFIQRSRKVLQKGANERQGVVAIGIGQSKDCRSQLDSRTRTGRDKKLFVLQG